MGLCVTCVAVRVDTLFASVTRSTGSQVKALFANSTTCWCRALLAIGYCTIRLQYSNPGMNDTIFVIFSVSADVGKTIHSPPGAPRVLNDPVSWSVAYQ